MQSEVHALEVEYQERCEQHEKPTLWKSHKIAELEAAVRYEEDKVGQMASRIVNCQEELAERQRDIVFQEMKTGEVQSMRRIARDRFEKEVSACEFLNEKSGVLHEQSRNQKVVAQTLEQDILKKEEVLTEESVFRRHAEECEKRIADVELQTDKTHMKADDIYRATCAIKVARTMLRQHRDEVKKDLGDLEWTNRSLELQHERLRQEIVSAQAELQQLAAWRDKEAQWESDCAALQHEILIARRERFEQAVAQVKQERTMASRLQEKLDRSDSELKQALSMPLDERCAQVLNDTNKQ